MDVVSREGGPDEGSANEAMLETDGGTTDSDAGFIGTAEPAAAGRNNGIFNVLLFAWGSLTPRAVTISASTPMDNVLSACNNYIVCCFKCMSSLRWDGF